MKCDSQASLLARTLASPCLGCKPKVRVATLAIIVKIIFVETTLSCNQRLKNNSHTTIMQLSFKYFNNYAIIPLEIQDINK
jgi:hypothetical protein